MNKKEEYQEIYINLDDSGKLTKKEKVSTISVDTLFYLVSIKP